MPRVWEKGASGDFDRVAGTGRVSVSLSSGPGPRDASPKRKGTAPGWGDKLDAALRSAWPGGVVIAKRWSRECPCGWREQCAPVRPPEGGSQCANKRKPERNDRPRWPFPVGRCERRRIVPCFSEAGCASWLREREHARRATPFCWGAARLSRKSRPHTALISSPIVAATGSPRRAAPPAPAGPLQYPSGTSR